jgi:heterodisulfide reductase subunit A
VRFTDVQGQLKEEPFDLAVLSVGLRAAENLPEWARRLGVAVNEHGFFKTEALTPGCTGRDGVLVCGTAREPMDISETVTTAGAAAAAAVQLLALSPRSRAPELPLPDPSPEAPPRIGVFLCHCGINIAETVDLEKLGAATRRLPGVVHVEDELFACSADATRRMAETIRTLKLNRVVVAACTPRTHEAVFREVVAAAGLNPGYFAFANIREQCSWVHQNDPAAALNKARKLVAMAVRQALVLPPIRLQTFPVIPRALVLGGGAAGMSAALTLADQGFHTYLVERERYLGGLVRKLFFTLEGPDPQAFLQELQGLVFRHPNIEVLTQTKLIKVEGHVGQFQSIVRQRLPDSVRERSLEHGVILVAIGGREFHPRGRYLYGEDPRVLTQLELEALIDAQDLGLSGVRRVVMIQCVGSREPEHRYCSRVCCSEAVKNALLLKERYPALEITVLYRDLRAYGFREIYYQQAKEKGVVFIPFEPERPPRVAGTRFRPLTVSVWDDVLGREVPLPADLVVLSTGIEPAPGTDQVARQLGVPLTAAGFFLEAHLKLRPVDTVAEGVFVCGLAHHPKSLGETVVQSQAAAMRAAGVLFQTELHRGELTAAIDPGRCCRCLACLEVCPFGAVRLAAARQPEILSQVCRGCGACVAECPGDAIQLSRFTEAELVAQIEAALLP